MVEIKLTQGKSALIDDADFDLVSKFKWCASKNRNNFYSLTGKKENRKKMHRLIMGVTDPNIIVDHVDGNGLNNQRHNLRLCTMSENKRNRNSSIKKKSSKYLGVTKGNRAWVASLRHNGILYRKSFDTEEKAAKSYNEMAKKYHGEFAKLNIIP